MYRVKWSPFVDDVFVSCGGDWRVAVWQQDRSHPVLGFQPSNVRTRTAPRSTLFPFLTDRA